MVFTLHYEKLSLKYKINVRIIYTYKNNLRIINIRIIYKAETF